MSKQYLSTIEDLVSSRLKKPKHRKALRKGSQAGELFADTGSTIDGKPRRTFLLRQLSKM
jgi:hypothetical protein